MSHYDVHSLYGYSEGQPTHDACEEVTGKRCITVSRSTYPGVQRYIGHWHGDNTSKWSHVKQSLIATIEFSIYGFSYTGPDTCGFFEDSTEELCQRWMQLGAFFVYSRNHNGITFRRQDPAAWGSKFANMSKNILMERYRMLPYLYTLLYRAHVHGDSVVRSLLSNYPEDKTAWDIDEQMMWGNGLLIAPVLTEATTTVNVYFPEQRWYDYYSGAEQGTRGDWEEVNAPLDFIPLYLRGGEIVSVQKPAQTTMDARMNDLGLIVSLDDDMEATGELYWDEGNSIEPIKNGKFTLVKFFYQKGHLRSEVIVSDITQETHENSGQTVDLVFSHFEINGLSGFISKIVINGKELDDNGWQQNRNGRLQILDSGPLPIGEQFDIFIELDFENSRCNCMPGGGTAEECNAKGCIWSESRNPGVPWCYYSHQSNKINYGYRAPDAFKTETEMSGNEFDVDLTNANQDGSYSDPIENAKFQIRRINSNQARVKLTDSSSSRYEISQESLNYPNQAGSQSDNTFDIITGNA